MQATADEMGRLGEVGVTVLGDFVLSEGAEAILDRLQDAGVTHVTFNPTVTAPAPEGVGSFQPPVDAGASPRRFDRPLFGKPALWLQSAISFQPRVELYRGLKYGPRRVNELTEKHGLEIRRFVTAAHERGLRIAVQLGAAQPTGLTDDDRPRGPDGTVPAGRLADTGCLVSPAVRDYNRAYLRDVLTEYPEVTDVRIDWPEFPCYTLGEVFQGFGPHVEKWAEAHGWDYAEIRSAAAALQEHLAGRLTNDELAEFAAADASALPHLRFPGAADWLRMKSAMSLDLLRDWRTALDECGPGRRLIAHAFMPTYSVLTGFDFAAAADAADGIAAKLYTMHWSLMIEFWGRRLQDDNPQLDETVVVAALERLMEIEPRGADFASTANLGDPANRVEPADRSDPADGSGPVAERPFGLRTLADYGYPQPDEPHPISAACQRNKIRQVLRQVGGRADVYPLVHGYGPVDDFSARLQLALAEPTRGVFINRYGYLSNEKLSRIGKLARSYTLPGRG